MTYQEFASMELPYPDAECGDHVIQSVEVDEWQAMLSNARHGKRACMRIVPGIHRRLGRKPSTTVMSTTRMEAKTNWRFVNKASGRVLINGLGLGWVPSALAQKDDVTSVTVVEYSKDVISLVAPHLPKKVCVINGDAFTTRPAGVFDYVWHDIWDSISISNLAEMARLFMRYKYKAGWQGCWSATLIYLRMFEDREDSHIEPEKYSDCLEIVKCFAGARMGGSRFGKLRKVPVDILL